MSEYRRIEAQIESEYKYLWSYVQDKVAQLEAHKARAAQSQAVADALERAVGEIEGAYLYVTVQGQRVYAQVTGLNSFGEVAGLARIVAKGTGKGFKGRSFEKESMCVQLQNDEFELVCYVSGANATCKRVKVGTKTVEQDVFEVQCADGDEPDLSDVGALSLDVHAGEEDAGGLPPLDGLQDAQEAGKALRGEG